MPFLWTKLLVPSICSVSSKQLQFMQESVRLRGRFAHARGSCGISGIGTWLQSFLICSLKKSAQPTLNDANVVLKVATVIVEIWDRTKKGKQCLSFPHINLRHHVRQLYYYLNHDHDHSISRYLTNSLKAILNSHDVKSCNI